MDILMWTVLLILVLMHKFFSELQGKERHQFNRQNSALINSNLMKYVYPQILKSISNRRKAEVKLKLKAIFVKSLQQIEDLLKSLNDLLTIFMRSSFKIHSVLVIYNSRIPNFK